MQGVELWPIVIIQATAASYPFAGAKHHLAANTTSSFESMTRIGRFFQMQMTKGEFLDLELTDYVEISEADAITRGIIFIEAARAVLQNNYPTILVVKLSTPASFR